jgi:hypothetical protein
MSCVHFLIGAGIVIGFVGLFLLFTFLIRANKADERHDQIFRERMDKMNNDIRRERERYLMESR